MPEQSALKFFFVLLVVVAAVAAGTIANWSRDMTFVNCSNSRARVLWIGGQWMRCWVRMGGAGGMGQGSKCQAHGGKNNLNKGFLCELWFARLGGILLHSIPASLCRSWETKITRKH